MQDRRCFCFASEKSFQWSRQMPLILLTWRKVVPCNCLPSEKYIWSTKTSIVVLTGNTLKQKQKRWDSIPLQDSPAESRLSHQIGAFWCVDCAQSRVRQPAITFYCDTCVCSKRSPIMTGNGMCAAHQHFDMTNESWSFAHHLFNNNSCDLFLWQT